MNLAGSVVLITGSGQGIGAACATALLTCGARVIIHARKVDGLYDAAADPEVAALTADFTNEWAVDELADAAREVYGRVDAVVHCAGVGWYGDAGAMSPDSVDEVLNVNLRAPVRLTRALLPDMLRRGYGHHSFIGSIAGLTGVAHEAVYAASKAGLITFAESLQLELAGTGVGVSTVSPAAVRTKFFDHRGAPYGRRFPRPISPERVAAAVVHGIADDCPSQVVPRWLAVAPVARAAFPGVFRTLSRRFG